MIKKQLKLIFPFIFLCFSAQGQDIQWIDFKKEDGNLVTFIPESVGGNFYTLGLKKGSYYLTHYKNFNSIATEKRPFFETYHFYKGQLTAFWTENDKESRTVKQFFQPLNEFGKSIGEPKECVGIVVPEGRKNKGSYKTISSPNKRYLAVLGVVEVREPREDRVKYKILDAQNNFDIVQEGQYVTEEREEDTIEIVKNEYLSDDGELFQTVRSTVKKVDFTTWIIRRLTESASEDMIIVLPDGKHVSEGIVSKNRQNILTIIGVYSSDYNGNIVGAFFKQIDFGTKKILKEDCTEFSQEVIRGLSNNQKEPADEKKTKLSYSFRTSIVTDDGSIVGILENDYIKFVNTSPGSATAPKRTDYYFLDLIAFKVGPGGTFDWIINVPKFQYSSDDYGVYSSCFAYVSYRKLSILFNDTKDNYTESGQYQNRSDGKIASSQVIKLKNVVAKVDVDLNSGEVDRKIFFSRKDVDALAVPRYFESDVNNQELFLFLQKGGNQKFGIMKI